MKKMSGPQGGGIFLTDTVYTTGVICISDSLGPSQRGLSQRQTAFKIRTDELSYLSPCVAV